MALTDPRNLKCHNRVCVRRGETWEGACVGAGRGGGGGGDIALWDAYYTLPCVGEDIAPPWTKYMYKDPRLCREMIAGCLLNVPGTC